MAARNVARSLATSCTARSFCRWPSVDGRRRARAGSVALQVISRFVHRDGTAAVANALALRFVHFAPPQESFVEREGFFTTRACRSVSIANCFCTALRVVSLSPQFVAEDTSQESMASIERAISAMLAAMASLFFVR